MSTVQRIEDNVQNRYLATYLLEHNGFIVEAALDGPQGIALAGTLLPDLVLLDIQLPGMDRYNVARALRRMPTQRAMPIIAVAMAGNRDTAVKAGCDGYIEKPIDPQTFVAEISAYLPLSAAGTTP